MLLQIKEELEATGTLLVAVSKTRPLSAIQTLYDRGQRVFGENRALEMAEKHAALPTDIEWHLIGHLQRNKVKRIAPFVGLIHAVDSARLLEEIDRQAAANDRTIDCLLQFKIAREEGKYGWKEADALSYLQSEAFQSLRHIRLTGVMGMATFTDNEEQVRKEFRRLKSIFDNLKNGVFKGNPDFKHISMGMSGDYRIAVEEGSTMVRIGSLIFNHLE